MLAIIDYGMGNLHSISKAVQHVSSDTVLVTSDRDKILEADRVVFPGVGAIRDCMAELQNQNLVDVIREVAASRPLLGVCLGMQALLDHSEENNGIDCLGLVPGKVRGFSENLTDPASGDRLKIPHMGWNTVRQARAHPLWAGIDDQTRFYFVHSYYVETANAEDCVGSTDYPTGFTSALAHKNIFAAQFHPEKSHTAGLTLLKNFAAWNGDQ